MFLLFSHLFRKIKLYCLAIWEVHLFACLPPCRVVKVQGQQQSCYRFTHLLKDTSKGWMHSVIRSEPRPSRWRAVYQMTKRLFSEYRNSLSTAKSNRVEHVSCASEGINNKILALRQQTQRAANWVYNYQNMKGGKVAHQRTNKHVTSGLLRNHSLHLPWKWLPPNGVCGGEQKNSKQGLKNTKKIVFGCLMKQYNEFNLSVWRRGCSCHISRWSRIIPPYFELIIQSYVYVYTELTKSK